MDDYQVMTIDNSDLTTWDFDQMKAELQSHLEQFQGLAYTEDNIKDAKSDRTKLNKAKKAIEDGRRAYKAKCLEPYDQIEPKIKELISLIEEQRTVIDETVKEFESRQKAEKERVLRDYYDRKAIPLGNFAEPLYEKLFDSKWLNATSRMAKCEEEIQIRISKACSDLNEIRHINSPFVDTLIEEYIRTLSVDEVRKKHEELTTQVDKAGLLNKDTEVLTKPVQTIATSVDSQTGTLLRVYASKSQLEQLTDFMKLIGVEYQLEQ